MSEYMCSSWAQNVKERSLWISLPETQFNHSIE